MRIDLAGNEKGGERRCELTHYRQALKIAPCGVSGSMSNGTESRQKYRITPVQAAGHKAIAAHFRDTMEDRRALRGYVVDEVLRTNGQIKFEDAQDVQRQLPDDTWRN